MSKFFCSLLLLATSAGCKASWDELEFTGYLAAGMGYQQNILAPLDRTINGKPLLNLSADLHYRNFFIESDDRRNVLRYGSGTLGYQLWHNDAGTLALIGTSYHEAVGPDLETGLGRVHIPEFEGLTLRDSDFSVGLRYQYFRQDHYFALELGQEIESHYGQQLRLLYSYRQMLRNWDLYYNAGLAFSSARLVNYYYGVRNSETALMRPVYTAGAGQQLHLGLSAVYPLAPDWLLELGIAVNGFSSAYTDSPLVSRDIGFQSQMKFSYVF